MPITTLNPTVNTTPDQASTLAVSGISNNGHTFTLTATSAFDSEDQPPQDNSDSRSARWSGFAAGPGSLISLKLKFNWSITGNVAVVQHVSGTGLADILFKIEYSVNGGSSWTTFVSKSRAVGTNNSDSINESGSEIVELSLVQNTTLVQVRVRMDANASASAPAFEGADVTSSANLTTTISGIVVEAETASAAPSKNKVVSIW